MSGKPWFLLLVADFVSARNQHAALLMAIDDGDDYGEHVGLQRHRRAVYDGQAEMLAHWRESLERAYGRKVDDP